MKLFIRNIDAEENTLLVSAVQKVPEDRFNILNPEPTQVPDRKVLRPQEEMNVTLENGYILAIEKL